MAGVALLSFLAGALSPNAAIRPPAMKAAAQRLAPWIQEIFLPLMENICLKFSGFGGHFNPGQVGNRALSVAAPNFAFR